MKSNYKDDGTRIRVMIDGESNWLTRMEWAKLQVQKYLDKGGHDSVCHYADLTAGMACVERKDLFIEMDLTR